MVGEDSEVIVDMVFDHYYTPWSKNATESDLNTFDVVWLAY